MQISRKFNVIYIKTRLLFKNSKERLILFLSPEMQLKLNKINVYNIHLYQQWIIFIICLFY